jgi:hypothetical protein
MTLKESGDGADDEGTSLKGEKARVRILSEVPFGRAWIYVVFRRQYHIVSGLSRSQVPGAALTVRHTGGNISVGVS